MLNRITLQVGNSAMGACDNSENPSKMNSCWSCLTIVGVLVRKLVGGEMVILCIEFTGFIGQNIPTKSSQ